MALGEISFMLSRAKVEEEREVEAALEDSREKLIDSFHCLVGLEKTIEELKGKIAQDQAELPE